MNLPNDDIQELMKFQDQYEIKPRAVKSCDVCGRSEGFVKLETYHYEVEGDLTICPDCEKEVFV